MSQCASGTIVYYVTLELWKPLNEGHHSVSQCTTVVYIRHDLRVVESSVVRTKSNVPSGLNAEVSLYTCVLYTSVHLVTSMIP